MGGISDRGGSEGLDYGGSGNGLNGDSGGLFVDDGVESVDGVGGVFDSTDAAVRFDKAVASLDDVSLTRFLLVFGVTSEVVLDVVGVAVRRVGVVVGVDGDSGFSDGGGGGVSCGGVDSMDSGGGIGQGGGVDSLGSISHRGGVSTGSNGCSMGEHLGCAEDTRLSDSHEGGEDDQLQKYYK